MKLFSILLGLLLLISLPASASRECKEKYRTYAQQLARLEPEADLDILGFDFFKGGSFVAGYEYEVEPAYTRGLYSRADRWVVDTRLIPNKPINLEDGIDLNLTGGVQSRVEATFIRFMKDPCEAMLANPYAPHRMPLKASIALGKKFQKGDYFLFRGSLGFVTSAEILSMLGSTMWGIGLSGNYLLEGFYELHIVRLDETHIRLKIIGHRGNGKGLTLGLGYEDKFNVFGVRQIDKQLERFVNTKPIKLTASVGNTGVFLLDYVLDLSDQEVASAYEKVLKKVKHFQNIELLAPFRKQKDLANSILLDLSPLEDLYREDYAAGRMSRLKRNLKTTSKQFTYGFGLNAGNRVLGFKLDGRSTNAEMSINTPSDLVDRYVLRTWEKSHETRFLYSWSKNREEDSLYTLFKADEEFEELVPLNIVRNMRQKKNRFTYSDLHDLKFKLKKYLPLEVYQQIPWENWPQTRKDKFNNFGLRFELLMSPESILEAPELSKEEIKVLFKDHLLSKGLEASDFYSDTLEDSNAAEDSFELSLNQVSALLEKAMDQNLSIKERIKIFNKVRKNQLFEDCGMSFLMTLSPDKMAKLYHLDLDISANEGLIKFTFGDSQATDLYKKILTIKAALDDEALDIIREAESLSSNKLI